MPALRGGNSRGIRHLESLVGRLEGACYSTLMELRDLRLEMKKVRRMQFLEKFFVDVRRVHTRSTGHGHQRGYYTAQPQFGKLGLLSVASDCQADKNRSPLHRLYLTEPSITTPKLSASIHHPLISRDYHP